MNRPWRTIKKAIFGSIRNDDLFGEAGEVSLLNVVRALYSGRVLLVVVICISLAVGLYLSYSIPPMYKARVSMFIQNNQSAGSGTLQQLSGLTSVLGLTSGQSGLTVDPVDLTHSVWLKDALLDIEWQTQKFQEPVSLYEYWELGEGGEADLVEQAVARDRLDLRISIARRPTDLFLVSCLMEEPTLAAAVADSITSLLGSKYAELHLQKTKEERQFVESRLALSKASLEQSEDAIVEFVGSNLEYRQSAQLRDTYSRLEREAQVANQLYLTLRQQFEVLRIEEVRSKPVFSILDSAEIPQERYSPQRGRIMIICGILGVVFGVMGVLLVAYSKFLGSYINGAGNSSRSTPTGEVSAL